MLDTIGFVNSINTPHFEQAVTQYFDQHLMLYNLIGSCNNIQRIDGEMSESSMSFILQFNSEEEAKKMQFILLNKIACIFNRRFSIVEELRGSSLIVKFVE